MLLKILLPQLCCQDLQRETVSTLARIDRGDLINPGTRANAHRVHTAIRRS